MQELAFSSPFSKRAPKGKYYQTLSKKKSKEGAYFCPAYSKDNSSKGKEIVPKLLTIAKKKSESSKDFSFFVQCIFFCLTY